MLLVIRCVSFQVWVMLAHSAYTDMLQFRIDTIPTLDTVVLVRGQDTRNAAAVFHVWMCTYVSAVW